MKIIAALSVYEEEQFIYKTLESLLQIKDLTAIHILEGAWKGGGDSARSRDKTVSEIERFMQSYTSPLRPHVFLEHHPYNTFFENQSHKRNFQLQRIAEIVGSDDYYVFVVDGDEEIRFPNGLREIWLRELLNEKHPSVGMLKTYADNSDNGLWTARLLPFYKYKSSVHYHTGQNMTIHDGNCKIISDYWTDLPKPGDGPGRSFFDSFFIVNKYPLHTEQRLKQKALQYATEQERRKKGEECTFARS